MLTKEGKERTGRKGISKEIKITFDGKRYRGASRPRASTRIFRQKEGDKKESGGTGKGEKVRSDEKP